MRKRPEKLSAFLKFTLVRSYAIIFHMLPNCLCFELCLKAALKEAAALKIQTQTTTYTSLEL